MAPTLTVFGWEPFLRIGIYVMIQTLKFVLCCSQITVKLQSNPPVDEKNRGAETRKMA